MMQRRILKEVRDKMSKNNDMEIEKYKKIKNELSQTNSVKKVSSLLMKLDLNLRIEQNAG